MRESEIKREIERKEIYHVEVSEGDDQNPKIHNLYIVFLFCIWSHLFFG
jgi:hypothetical protein